MYFNEQYIKDAFRTHPEYRDICRLICLWNKLNAVFQPVMKNIYLFNTMCKGHKVHELGHLQVYHKESQMTVCVGMSSF